MSQETTVMSSRRSPLHVAVLAVGVLLLAGCGDGTDAAAPDAPEPDPEPPETHEVEVYFTNLELGETGEVFPVERETTEEDLPLAAFSELLAGPTASEHEEGYSSFFSEQTQELLRSLEVEDGTALVDFDARLPDVIPNASTSAGSASLLAELDATLEQFDEITATRYHLDGDAAAFYEWLQLAVPEEEA